MALVELHFSTRTSHFLALLVKNVGKGMTSFFNLLSTKYMAANPHDNEQFYKIVTEKCAVKGVTACTFATYSWITLIDNERLFINLIFNN